ncbi:winged helix-turn-helix transcriptional regulator [bacterium]|nr:winged helix-turn-helix transcriptional regulator [bacterium]
MNDEYTEECNIFKALSHPMRLKIVMGIYENECNVSEIQDKLGIPQSTISQHLNVLKNSKIIIGRREGTKVCYKVINATVTDIINLINKKTK